VENEDHFTTEERRLLSAHFTNLDKPVFALVNLPEVVKGALFARYSRSAKSLRRLFLDEFAQGKPELAGSSNMGIERAERLYDRILTDYGDDSVAQLGGVHVACEQVSNVLTKQLEWGRLMAYLEQSTRYVPYIDRPQGHWKYRLPAEIESPDLRKRCQVVLDDAFETYSFLLQPLRAFFTNKFPKSASDSQTAYQASIRSKALDTLRGLLPAATISNLGVFGTAQGYEHMILRLRSCGLAEADMYSDLILEELNKVVPAFMRRVDEPQRGGVWVDYLKKTAQDIARVSRTLLSGIQPHRDDEVVLTDFDPQGEIKVVAAALYASSQLSDVQLLTAAREMTVDDRLAVLRAYVGQRRNRRHKPGRAFERTGYRFDITTDYGAFRDLQRHRILTLEWQPLSCHHGYRPPDEIQEFGASGSWNKTMDASAELYEAVFHEHGAAVAQYVVPMAYRVRFYMQLNAREAMHVLELRTSPQGHPSYRRICQKMHTLIIEQAEHRAIGGAMSFVNHEDVQLERLNSEKASEIKRSSTDGS